MEYQWPPGSLKKKNPVGRHPQMPPRFCACTWVCSASGGPISCPVKKWGKETAGGRFRFLPPGPYLKRRKGSVPLRIPPAQRIDFSCRRISALCSFLLNHTYSLWGYSISLWGCRSVRRRLPQKAPSSHFSEWRSGSGWKRYAQTSPISDVWAARFPAP